MWQFFAWFLVFRRRRFPRTARVVFLLFAIGIVLAGLIYTAVVFNALQERNRDPHVHTNRTH